MGIEEKIRNLLFESTFTPADPGSSANSRRNDNKGPGFKDPGSGAGGGKIGFKANEADKPAALRKKDARRKRRERARVKKTSGGGSTHSITENSPEIDRRANLEGDMRLTLKETFVKNLLEYVMTRKSKYIREAIQLMEEYPKLKSYVMRESQKSLPTRGFAVYSVRESTMNEEVGKAGYRSGKNVHNWCLNRQQARRNADVSDSYYVMESKILPKHVLLYLPAFASEIENLIFSGKIEEPHENPVRKVKQQNEAILPSHMDTGMIVEVH